jgi:hypothetical protein
MYSLSRNLSSEPTVKPTACAKTTSKNVDVATSALSIVFAVASDDRILRDTAMAEEPSPLPTAKKLQLSRRISATSQGSSVISRWIRTIGYWKEL